jgi:SAM-dependent methyltransferase
VSRSKPDKRKQKRAKRKGGLTAKTADKHALYETSVQSPEADIEFVERAFKEEFGREPLVLREDFGGTALLACNWVASSPERRAMAIDLDPDPLAYGEERHRAPLGEAAERVTLLEADVRSVSEPKADVTVALNFSYFCFQTRSDLVAYFKHARSALADEGLLVLDCFGGTESMEIMEEENEKDGFSYLWDQDEFDPVTHRLQCFIHFAFPDGTKLNKAFSYDWRLWTLPEIVDCLKDAGFETPQVWWEGFDEDGEGDGEYERVDEGEPCEGFVCYVTAKR